MLTWAPGLTVYNPFLMRSVTSTLVQPVLSPYLPQYIVMLIQYLHDNSLLTGSNLDADIVCSRSKHHYDPGLDLSMSETMTNTTEAGIALERHRQAFKPTHERMKKLMYFC